MEKRSGRSRDAECTRIDISNSVGWAEELVVELDGKRSRWAVYVRYLAAGEMRGHLMSSGDFGQSCDKFWLFNKILDKLQYQFIGFHTRV